MTGRSHGETEIRVAFGDEEVEGRAPNSPARLQAQRARRDIEAGRARLAWKRCRSEDAPDGTSLPGCVKLYLPLDGRGRRTPPTDSCFVCSGSRTGAFR